MIAGYRARCHLHHFSLQPAQNFRTETSRDQGQKRETQHSVKIQSLFRIIKTG